jgi:uncharacterized protein with ParB-like and HNH nuclease domain
MNNQLDIFETSIVDMHDVAHLKFIIPTYQRPYVWGEEQIKKLLDDFHLSYTNNPSENYYVSTFLTKEESNQAELIDGQQRFTSLWLIAFAISQIAPESEIRNFLKQDNKLRFGFEIRSEVLNYLEGLLDSTGEIGIHETHELEKQPYVINIAKGLSTIKGYLATLKKPNNEKEDLKKFGDFIYHKVKLIKNTAPNKTDLNKLFSTINSAGVQLEQTDIVKANLLNLIDEKVKFGRIWEACENMDDYFERNVRKSFPNSPWKNKMELDLSNFTQFRSDLFKYDSDAKTNDHKTESFSIDSFELDKLESYGFPKSQIESEKDRESDEVYCRSVINFGQLLLHTYRIHLHRENLNDFEGTFHVNRIIEIFKSMQDRNDSDEIKRFFYLLWDVRYLFDKYIIKWVSDSSIKQDTLELVNINRNNEGYYTRTKYEKSASLMLQSVLYFTGDYLRQYWLTTYINYLLENHKDKSATDKEHLSYLEKLDNTLSLNRSSTDKTLTFQVLNSGLNEVDIDVDIETELNMASGTSFRHYWFQKLEYILWKNWGKEENSKFTAFRIMSKNSIEHIYPQNPENRRQHPELSDDILHSFGNLVLLSVAQNSEYSNKSVKVKKSMFDEKTETYDSLKSYFIFSEHNEWTKTEIEKHKESMIKQIKKHYKNAEI